MSRVMFLSKEIVPGSPGTARNRRVSTEGLSEAALTCVLVGEWGGWPRRMGGGGTCGGSALQSIRLLQAWRTNDDRHKQVVSYTFKLAGRTLSNSVSNEVYLFALSATRWNSKRYQHEVLKVTIYLGGNSSVTLWSGNNRASIGYSKSFALRKT